MEYQVQDIICLFCEEYKKKKDKKLIEKYAKKLFVDLFIEA